MLRRPALLSQALDLSRALAESKALAERERKRAQRAATRAAKEAQREQQEMQEVGARIVQWGWQLCINVHAAQCVHVCVQCAARVFLMEGRLFLLALRSV